MHGTRGIYWISMILMRADRLKPVSSKELEVPEISGPSLAGVLKDYIGKGRSETKVARLREAV